MVLLRVCWLLLATDQTRYRCSTRMRLVDFSAPLTDAIISLECQKRLPRSTTFQQSIHEDYVKKLSTSKTQPLSCSAVESKIESTTISLRNMLSRDSFRASWWLAGTLIQPNSEEWQDLAKKILSSVQKSIQSSEISSSNTEQMLSQESVDKKCEWLLELWLTFLMEPGQCTAILKSSYLV